MVDYVINIYYTIAILVLTALAGVFAGYFLLSKPLELFKRKMKWDQQPRITLSMQKKFEKDIQKFFEHLPHMNFETRCLLVQKVFGKDIRIIVGLNGNNQLWIDAVGTYPYGEQAQGES